MDCSQKHSLTDILNYYLQRILNGVQDFVQDDDVKNIISNFNEELNMNICGSILCSEDYGVRLHRLKSYASFIGEPKNIIIAIFVPIYPFPGENVRYSVCIRKDNFITTMRMILPPGIQ